MTINWTVKQKKNKTKNQKQTKYKTRKNKSKKTGDSEKMDSWRGAGLKWG